MKTKFVLLALVIAIQCAAAQDRPPKSDASKPVAGGGTPIPFSTAAVVAVTPTEVVLKLSDGKTRAFKFAGPSVSFDKDGVPVQDNATIKGSRVLAHFMEENGHVLVDRLLVQP